MHVINCCIINNIQCARPNMPLIAVLEDSAVCASAWTEACVRSWYSISGGYIMQCAKYVHIHQGEGMWGIHCNHWISSCSKQVLSQQDQILHKVNQHGLSSNQNQYFPLHHPLVVFQHCNMCVVGCSNCFIFGFKFLHQPKLHLEWGCLCAFLCVAESSQVPGNWP